MTTRFNLALRWVLIALNAGALLCAAEIAPLTYDTVGTVTAATTPAPIDKRAPFGWASFPISHEKPTLLQWTAPAVGSPPVGAARFRLTVAIDDRTERHVEISLAKTGRHLGSLNLRLPQALQLFELILSEEDAVDAQREGLALQLRAAGAPLWFFSPTSATDACPRELQPHLLHAAAEHDPSAEFFRRLASRASVIPFGWQEGCVLDGLRALAAGDAHSRFETARRAHWALFLTAEDRLIYESGSRPVDDKFDTIEGTLPIADLALWSPSHRGIGVALDYLARNKRPTGLIYGGTTITAEGSYTVGFPLAVVAAQRGDHALAIDALNQFIGRRDRLWHDGALWLRHSDKGVRTFRNWSRGVTWYFLGMVRALPHLRAAGLDVSALETEIRRTAAFVRGHQLPSGLWRCFLDEPASAPDTSGSAGIAAALALGARAGVLSADDLAAARLTVPALFARLTPDGFLTGVTQGNRGGEELQRSDYRVISPMGMGLMAQLIAATQTPSVP